VVIMSSATSTVQEPSRPPTTSTQTAAEIKPGRTSVFWREFFKAPKQLGTCFTSSKPLARRMVKGLPLGESKLVFELGPGTGPITAQILPLLGAQTRFVGIEQNSGLVRELKRRFPQHTFLEDDALDLQGVCRRQAIEAGTVDCVITSVPYLLFTPTMQERGLDEVLAVLRPGGTFTMLTYCIEEVMAKARRWRGFLEKRFQNVQRSQWVIQNTPPAFVYRGVKG